MTLIMKIHFYFDIEAKTQYEKENPLVITICLFFGTKEMLKLLLYKKVIKVKLDWQNENEKILLSEKFNNLKDFINN
jgi:hypothetical protein